MLNQVSQFKLGMAFVFDSPFGSRADTNGAERAAVETDGDSHALEINAQEGKDEGSEEGGGRGGLVAALDRARERCGEKTCKIYPACTYPVLH